MDQFMKQFSPCVYDAEDELLGTDYEFTDLGIRFWRELPFHEKLLQSEEYKYAEDWHIEEMYRYLYFDMVTVKKNSDS